MRIEVKGLKRVNRFLIQLPKKLDKELTRTNENFIDDIVMTAKARAPKDTGELKESIHKVKTITKGKIKQFKVVVDAPHAAFQELGFTPHAFYADETLNSSKLSPNRRYYVRKNTPFLVPAFDQEITKLTKRINLGVTKLIK